MENNRNPYIVELMTRQYMLEDDLTELDQSIELFKEREPENTETLNHMILARAGLTSDLKRLAEITREASNQIERGELLDPSFAQLLKEVER